MATYQPNPRIELTVPDSLQLTEGGEPARRRRRRRPGGGATTPEGRALIQALERQDLEVLHEFAAEEGRRPRRGRSPGRIRVKVEDIGPRESAVVLMEQDGVYSWVPPDPPTERMRRTRQTSPAPLTFTIPLTHEARPARPSRRRGLIKEVVVGKMRGLVLKFVAGPAVGGAVRLLERNVRSGPVMVRSKDPTKWQKVEALELALPSDRPAKVLLLVHGTFSSTVGSFGGLGLFADGKRVLDGLLKQYDYVIGWDHRTLSQTPLENATDLYDALSAITWPHPPIIDAVSFSRGGLVFRSLVEYLLPVGSLDARVGRAVFVGCTNGGTQLADPDNWQALLDLYTNIAVGASKAIGMVTQQHIASKVLGEAVSGLGAFAKAVVRAGIDDEGVPGLAAMNPDGPIVTDINRWQQGQPTAADALYYAVTSTFDASGRPPGEFPALLAKKLADRFSDRLMKAPNDLVVDVKSMSSIDPDHGTFIKDRLDFGPNGTVYHTVYFHQPQVADKLGEWLGEETPSTRVRESMFDPAFLGRLARVEPPAPVDRRVRRLPVTMRSDSAVRTLLEHQGDYVILDREHGGQVMHYARRASEVIPLLEGSPEESVIDALDLHEHQRSPVVSLDELDVETRATEGEPIVVTGTGGHPIGVLDSGRAHDSGALAGGEVVTVPPPRRRRSLRSSGGSKRRTRTGRAAARRRRGTGGGVTANGGGGGATSAPEPPPPPDDGSGAEPTEGIDAFFRADAPSEVEVGNVGTVEVTVSAQELERLAGAVSETASARISTTEKLIIQLIAKAHCRTEGDARATVDPPSPGETRTLYFDFKPTHAGDGVLWVVFRQGSQPLATLVLEPAFVARGAETSTERTPAVGARAALRAGTTPPIDQLFIYDRVDGTQWFLQYDLSSKTLDIVDSYESKRSSRDRAQFVKDVYEDLESYWAQNQVTYDKFMRKVRSRGATLFDDLMPPELRRLIWENRDVIQSIQVISEEPFIPWEIVHVKKPGGRISANGRGFLGEMGLVRWLKGESTGWAPERIVIRSDRSHVVVPAYLDPKDRLPAAEAEADVVETLLGARPIEPPGENEVLDVLTDPSRIDHIHFACHGEADPADITNAGLYLNEREVDGEPERDVLLAETVESYAWLREGSPGSNRPLVFVNACQTGRRGPRLIGTGGFARAFIERGAGAFVGALWSIDDEPSLEFAKTFYERLRQGDSFSQATIAARAASKNAEDFTWLSYTVYANPYAVIDFR